MKNLLTFFILISCCGSPLFGAIIYWTGAVSSSWNEAGNWDCNCLPGPEDEVFIPQNTGVDITSGTIATILKLESRGTLYIEDGASLLIDCQQRAGLSGASFIVGELINEGNLVVSHVNSISALLTYPGTHLNNSGIIIVDQVACPLEDNCQLQDAVSFFGSTINTGTITLRNLSNMDGYSIQANFQNDGQLLGDSLLVSGAAITLNRATTLTNSSSGLIRLTNMQGERLSRGLGNVLDSVSVINEGTLEITFEQSESLGLHLGGTGTRLHNSGTIRIQGARSGLSLYNQASEFINEGEIILSGQSESGLSLKSTQLMAHNEGHIELTDGNSLRALDIGAISPGPIFLNTGSIHVDQYLQESNSARGIRFLSGSLINRGQIQLIGAGSGTGIEMQANASPLQQPAEGSISIDHFRWGLSHEVASGNAGILHLGNNLERAIVDNNIPLTNTGTLSGGARFDDGTLDLAPNCRIYPGDQYTTGEIIIGHDADLDSSIDIELDLRATPEAPEAYDRITGARSLQYSGVITINLGETFALRSGTFTLLKASGSAGGFSGSPTVILPDPPTGSAWRMEQTSTRLLLHLDLINAVQEQYARRGYKLYPNPVTSGGWMHVERPQETQGSRPVKWFNTQGQLVHQGNLEATGKCWAPRWLAPGMYYLYWTTASGQAYSRVIVQ